MGWFLVDTVQIRYPYCSWITIIYIFHQTVELGDESRGGQEFRLLIGKKKNDLMIWKWEGNNRVGEEL